MAQLREKGLRSGMIHPNSTKQDIVNIILAPGISTAHSISDISGRGIGMSAVQTFLNKVGGHIEIELKAPHDPRGDYYDFSFIITMPVGKQIPLIESNAA